MDGASSVDPPLCAEPGIDEAGQTRSHLPALVKLIFSNPFVTVARMQKPTGLTNQGARNVIRDAEARGWLREVGTMGRGGRMYWVASELFEIIDAPWGDSEMSS